MRAHAGSSNTEEIQDPLEHMLKKTGCIDFHYQLQECFAETQDWRKCQDHVRKFKECMRDYQLKQAEKYRSIEQTK